MEGRNKMIKKKPWIVTITILVLSLVVLFGGWFTYQTIQIKKPIENALASIEGIILDDLKIDRDQINVSISIQKIDNFQLTYHQIQDKLQPYLGKRQLNLDFKSKGIEDEKLMKAWSESYFYIAQAIDQHQYSLIPKTINALKKEYLLDKANYSMDENQIYIDLHQKNSSLYLILPRTNNLEVKKIG